MAGRVRRLTMVWHPSLSDPEASLYACVVGVSLILRMGGCDLFVLPQQGSGPLLILSPPLLNKFAEDKFQSFALCLLLFLSCCIDRWLVVHVYPGAHLSPASKWSKLDLFRFSKCNTHVVHLMDEVEKAPVTCQ